MGTPRGAPLSEERSADAGPFTTLDHVVLAVDELDRATATYRRLLGREPSWRGTHPGQGTANTLFRLDRTYVELLAAPGPGALADVVRGQLASRGEGLFAIVLGCPDADGAVATLRERGLHPSAVEDGQGTDERSGAVRRWRFSLLPERDTRGVRVGLIEHRSPPDALPLATAREGENAAVRGIDHVVVQSGTASETIALYRDRLGLRLALDREFPQWGMHLAFFRVGGITLEMAATLDEAKGAEGADRPWGISWRVPDVDAVHARLAREGFSVSEIRTGRRKGTRVFTVHDSPHGVATLVLTVDDPAAAHSEGR